MKKFLAFICITMCQFTWANFDDYAYKKMLTSKYDEDVREVAFAIYADPKVSSEILDIAAARFQMSIEGESYLSADTTSWMAKLLSKDKNGRYSVSVLFWRLRKEERYFVSAARPDHPPMYRFANHPYLSQS